MSEDRVRPSTRRSFLQAAGTAAAGSLGLAAVSPASDASDAAYQTPPLPSRSVEVLVCGGGPSGVAAAIAAARQGVQVLLVERYGRLGGMAVHGLVGPLMGHVESPLVDEVLRQIGGRQVDANRLDLEYATLVEEAGASLLLHAWACAAVADGGRVRGARLMTKAGLCEVAAKVVVDATGDGDVAFSAGAAFEQGRKSDGLLQPMSIMYRIAGVDESRAMTCGSEQEARRIRVGDATWEQVVMQAQAAGQLPATVGAVRLYRTSRAGQRTVNATQINGLDGVSPEDLTRAELEGRRQAYQVLDFLRRQAPGYEQAYVALMPAVVGVRETRRFLGLEYLERDDLCTGRQWPHAPVHNASFPIDIHNPAGSGQAEGRQRDQGIAAAVRPYDIPYGCLVPRDVDGLLLAGRLISGSHEAHASYRVQCIAMAIGAAAGAAAGCAVRRGTLPRAVDPRWVVEALA